MMSMAYAWVTIEGTGLGPLELEPHMYVRWPSMAQVLETEPGSSGRIPPTVNH